MNLPKRVLPSIYPLRFIDENAQRATMDLGMISSSAYTGYVNREIMDINWGGLVAEFKRLNPELLLRYELAQEQAKIANRAAVKRWAQDNPEKRYVKGARYHMRKLNAPISDFTPKDWERIKAAFEYKCAYCGSTENLERDHVVPLSRGGTHTIGNVVPACKSCNQKKHRRTPAEWGVWPSRLPLTKES